MIIGASFPVYEFAIDQVKAWHLITMIIPIFHIIIFWTKRERIEVARYNYDVGPTAFDIGQFGTSKDEFSQFITSVENQIKIAKQA